MAYPNGQVPQGLLITFAQGWLPNEGTWYHQLPPGTYAKHLTLVALAKRNTGRILKPSEGWSCYRPLHIQVYAKKIHGIWAATPGTSSHGMFWERIECAAIDYGNWSYVYNGNRAAFYRDVRAVGLEPGLISPQRGYPDEPWHVVDKQPWAAGAATGGGAVPFAPIDLEQSEEDEMKSTYNWWIDDKGQQQNLVFAIGGNGMQDFWTSSDGEYNTEQIRQYDLAGPGHKINAGHGDLLLKSLAETRAGKG